MSSKDYNKLWPTIVINKRWRHYLPGDEITDTKGACDVLVNHLKVADWKEQPKPAKKSRRKRKAVASAV